MCCGTVLIDIKDFSFFQFIRVVHSNILDYSNKLERSIPTYWNGEGVMGEPGKGMGQCFTGSCPWGA